MLRNVVVAGLFLGLFGCEWGYPIDEEDTTTRIVEGTCPDADTVATRWNDGEGERTEWHPVPLPTLCYYRADISKADTKKVPWVTLDSCKYGHDSFDDVRAAAKKSVVPDASGRIPMYDDYTCTPDGVVLMLPVDGDECPAPEAALSPYDADAGIEALELLASDSREPWRSCTYHIDYEATHHPFSCGGGGVFAPE